MPMGHLARVLGISGPTRERMGLPARTSTRVPASGDAFHAEAGVVPLPPARKGRRPARPAVSAPVPGAVLCIRFDGVARLASAPLGGTLSATMPPEGGSGLSANWDPDGFDLRAYGEGPVAFLRDLAGASISRDLAAWRVPATFPHSEGGLALAVASAVPDGLARDLAEADLARFRLEDAAAATGVAGRLADAGRHCLALSPAWVADVPRGAGMEGTTYPVAFWLNPLDQEAARAGWYTVEQLDAWVSGTGPVPVPGVDPDRLRGVAAALAMLAMPSRR